MNTILSNQNAGYQIPAIDLLCEIVPGDGCLGHIPAMPGLCFRGEDPSELERTAPMQIKKYVEWLIGEGLSDLNPLIATLAIDVHGINPDFIKLVNRENIVGSPVWISGNPAVLFGYDLHPLEDPKVLRHLRFTRQVLNRIGDVTEALPSSRMAQKLDQQRRSINEMLTHIGNCVWWYCSRIDDYLPEPAETREETPTHRIRRLFDLAAEYLISVPFPLRAIIHIPSRYHTNDPLEKWTHTKACRRQAEHSWEHLSELMQIVS